MPDSSAPMDLDPTFLPAIPGHGGQRCWIDRGGRSTSPCVSWSKFWRRLRNANSWEAAGGSWSRCCPPDRAGIRDGWAIRSLALLRRCRQRAGGSL